MDMVQISLTYVQFSFKKGNFVIYVLDGECTRFEHI